MLAKLHPFQRTKGSKGDVLEDDLPEPELGYKRRVEPDVAADDGDDLEAGELSHHHVSLCQRLRCRRSSSGKSSRLTYEGLVRACKCQGRKNKCGSYCNCDLEGWRTLDRLGRGFRTTQ